MKLFIDVHDLTPETQSKLLQFLIDADPDNMQVLLDNKEVRTMLRKKGFKMKKNIEVKYWLPKMKYCFVQEDE